MRSVFIVISRLLLIINSFQKYDRSEATLQSSRLNFPHLINESKNPSSFEFPSSFDPLGSANDRPPRSADVNVKEFIRQISVLARLANAIALQAGFADYKVPVETFVGELLNFGTSSKDVSQEVWKDVPLFVTSVKTAHSVLARTAVGSEKLEDVVLAWENIRKASSHVKAVNLSTVYETLEEFSFNSDSTVFDLLLNTPGRIEGQLKYIRNFELDNSGKRSATNAYKKLIAEIDNMKKGFDRAAELRSKFKSDPLIGAMDAFQSAKLFIQLTDDRRANDPSDKRTYVDDVNRRVSSLKPLLAALTPIKPKLEKLLDFVHSRQAPHKVKREFTSGFPQGVVGLNQLKTEIREPWLLKMVTDDGSADKLEKSLHPIFKGSDKISELDSKLKAILTPEAVTSVEFMSTVFKKVSKLSTSLEKPAEIVDKLIECNAKQSSFDANVYDTIKNDIAFIADFYAHYTNFISSEILNKDFAWFTKEMDDFMEFIDMKKEEDVTDDKLKENHQRIKTSQEIERLQSSIKKVDEARRGSQISISELDSVLRRKTETVNFFQTSALFSGEMEVYKCLKDLGETSEQVSHAIETARLLDEFETPPISSHATSMETFVTALIQYFKEFTSIHAIDSKVSKATREAGVELTLSKEISATIGQAVQYLEATSRLADIKPSLPQLQSVKDIVDNEITHISESAKRSTVLKNWGNHGQDLKNLQSSIKSVEKLMSNLGQSKVETLEDYGKVFKNLKPIPDVKFDAVRKSEALGAMITTGNNKSNLEMTKAKKTLDEISNLELEFSRFSSSLPNAPAAFKDFADVLTRFIRGVVETGSSILKTIFICVGAFAAILLIAGIVVLVLWKKKLLWFKPEEQVIVSPDAHTPNDLRECVSREYIHYYMAGYRFRIPLEAYEFHLTLLRMLRADDSKWIMTLFSQMTARKFRDPDTKLFYKNSLTKPDYHGNIIYRRKGYYYYALQGPMSASEHHEDTRSAFLETIVKNDLKQVTMLCRFQEPGPNGQMQEACAKYFSDFGEKSMMIGDWEVLTTHQRYLVDLKDTESEEDVMYRRLKISHMEQKYPTVEIEHYQHLNWDEGSFPPHGHQACFKISQRMSHTSSSAVAVHCSNGTGRTMAFIGMEFIAQEVQVDTTISFVAAAVKLASRRYNAIESLRQLYWMRVGVVYYLGQWFQLPMTYECHMEEFAKVAIDFAKHPEIPRAHGGLRF